MIKSWILKIWLLFTAPFPDSFLRLTHFLAFGLVSARHLICSSEKASLSPSLDDKPSSPRTYLTPQTPPTFILPICPPAVRDLVFLSHLCLPPLPSHPETPCVLSGWVKTPRPPGLSCVRALALPAAAGLLSASARTCTAAPHIHNIPRRGGWRRGLPAQTHPTWLLHLNQNLDFFFFLFGGKWSSQTSVASGPPHFAQISVSKNSGLMCDSNKNLLFAVSPSSFFSISVSHWSSQRPRPVWGFRPGFKVGDRTGFGFGLGQGVSCHG